MSNLINGPVNLVRLEGNINNINKVIYLFMDYHAPLTLQTKCESYASIDIVKYLYDNFKTSKNIIDFFFEIEYSQLVKPTNIFKKKYIHEVHTLFKKEFQKTKENKTLPSKINPNVRLHYIDIRDYLEHEINYYFSDMENIINKMKTNNDIFYNDLNNLNKICNILKGEFLFLKEIKITVLENKNYAKSDSYRDSIYYYLKKIVNKYNDEKLKINIINFLNSIDNYVNNILKHLDNILILLEKFKNYVSRDYDEKTYDKDLESYTFYHGILLEELINNIQNSYNKIYKNSIRLYCNIMDCYFLRRFLDKDYVTNVVAYTGILHSINYIYFLVKKYNFKVTHYNYSEEPNIKKLNEKLKKKNYKDLYSIFFPKKLIQCIDINNFPVNFE